MRGEGVGEDAVKEIERKLEILEGVPYLICQLVDKENLYMAPRKER